MTVTTVGIICDVSMPDDSEFTASRLDFTLSGPDFDATSNDAIPAATVSLTLDADGLGTIQLWPVDRGALNRAYSVTVIGSRVINGQTKAVTYHLGIIRPPEAGAPHDLADLLTQGAGPVVVGSTVYASIADAVAAAQSWTPEYAAEVLADAEAAAGILEGFATRDAYTFTTDSTVSNGRGPYALPYNPSDQGFIDLFLSHTHKKAGRDFNVVAMPSATSGYGVQFTEDLPDGLVVDYYMSRSLQADQNAAFLTPEQFGAVGNGSADDTAAIVATVASALASGSGVYFGKTYLTTGSIPNIHNIYKFGPGAIKVGSTVIPITPRQGDNITIYVDTSGNDANDGFSASQAVTTVARSLEIVRGFDAYVQGTWTIQLAAGTYTEEVAATGLFCKDNRITIQGPTAGHPNVPTAIIAAPTTSSVLFRATLGHRFRLIDLLFHGASNGQGVNNNGGFVTLVNCHSTETNNPIVAVNGAVTGIDGGIYDGTLGGSGSIGYSGFYNSVHDLTANSSAADAPIFQNFATGMQIGEGCQGHLDYVVLQDNNTGIDFKRGCGACNTLGMTVRRNVIGIKAHNSPWYDNQITWGAGADANTVNVDARGSAPEQKRQTLDHKMKAMRIDAAQEVIPTITLASTGVLEPLFTGPVIPDWAISEGGDQIEFTACLRLALTGNLALRAYMKQGATVDQFANVTVNAAATALYLTIRGSFDTEASFRGYIHAVDNAGTVYVANSDSALDFKNTEGQFQIQISGTATNTITGWTVCYKDTVGG